MENATNKYHTLKPRVKFSIAYVGRSCW